MGWKTIYASSPFSKGILLDILVSSMSICKITKTQIEGAFQAFDIPKFHQLNVSSVEEFEREYSDEWFDGSELIPPIELPHRLIISGFDLSHNKFFLAINLEKERIEGG